MTDIITVTKSIADKVQTGLDSFIKQQQWLNVVESPTAFNELKYFILSSEINAIINTLLQSQSTCLLKNDGLTPEYLNLYNNLDCYCSQTNEVTKVDSFQDLGKIYETLISIDFKIDNGSINYSLKNIKRNIQGAYFTPYELALSSAASMIEDWWQSNCALSTVGELKIADLSSGVGTFVIAFIDQLELFLRKQGKTHSEIQKITDNVCRQAICVDVDFLSLDISRFVIYERDNFRTVPQKANFKLGNPLLTSQTGTIEQKLSCFVTGKYYENENGLDLANHQFDIVLGNPPWEKIRLEERSFFAPYLCSSFKFTTKKERLKSIDYIKSNHSELFSFYEVAIDTYTRAKKDIKSNPIFRTSSIGELNTYILFTELALSRIKESGVVSLLVKTSILTSSVNKEFIGNIVSNNRLYKVSDFINKKSIFAIDNRERFCLLTLNKTNNDYFLYAGLLTQADQIATTSYWKYPYSYLKMLNPKTGVMTTFTSDSELEITVSVNKNNSNFGNEFEKANYGRLVHYTNHSDFLSDSENDNSLPVIEGKFISTFDGRYSTYEGVDKSLLYTSKAKSRLMSAEEKISNIPTARYFIDRDKWKSLSKNYKEEYFLAWRAMSSSSNARTCIATILNFQPSSQSIQFLQLTNTIHLVIASAIMNSMTFDYLLRRKLAGIDVTQTLIKQVSIPELSKFKATIRFNGKSMMVEDVVLALVNALYIHEDRLSDLFSTLNIKPLLIEKIDNISFLDALIARLYNITSKQYETILDDFRSCSKSKLKLEYFDQISLN